MTQSMNWVDIIILIFLTAAVGRGLRIGFWRQIFSLGGFFLGLFIGSWLVNSILHVFNAGTLGSILGAIATMVIAFAASEGGDYIGLRLKVATPKGILEKAESMLGIAVSSLSVLLVAWLLSAMLLRVPVPELDEGIETSRIVASLNMHLPSAPNLVTRLGKLISPNGFPQVFVDSEPTPTPVGQPASAEITAAANKAAASTVKIQGVGCGGIVTGSGFVVGPGLVATNAHVIAGIKRPVIIDQNGRHTAMPVVFNPNLDFAILRTTDLYGPVLELASVNMPRGTATAVMGYPGGGGLTVAAGVILAERTAVGRNIYDNGITSREIYELQADIEPGNSGGPMVLSDGRVAGVVFAKSTNSSNYGYALTAGAVAAEVARTGANSQVVATGRCTE